MRIFLVFILLCSVAVGCRSDINGDGFVDFQDLAILQSEWGCEEMANNYLKFNGTSQYVTVLNNAVLNPGTGNFSISFWGRMQFPLDAGPILTKNTATNGIDIIYTTGIVVLTLKDGTNTVSINAGGLSNTQWGHIVFTCDRAGYGNGYINGINISPDVYDISSVGDINVASNLIIGKDSTDYFQGSLDDIRIYKGKALNQAEVTAIYNARKGTKCTDAEIVNGWYSNCDEGAGNTTSGYAVVAGNPTELVGTLTGNVGDNMWEAGGVPFDTGTVGMLLNEKWSF